MKNKHTPLYDPEIAKKITEIGRRILYEMKKEMKKMESLFDVNGLMFWTQREIRLRESFAKHFSEELHNALLYENRAWEFIQFEGPQLTPRSAINPNYTNDDIWVQQNHSNMKIGEPFPEISSDLVLRPETTPSSYVYARHLLDTHSGIKPPFVIWQTGKSFRREQDQVIKNMRLKEFYQQEFQCIYTADTKNDYQEAVLEPVRKMIGEMVNLPTRLVESDRLPSYSKRTMDVEVWISDNINEPGFISDTGRWMEVCSISKRTDFPGTVKFQTKNKIVEKDLEVLEVAIGLDRINYCFEQGNIK